MNADFEAALREGVFKTSERDAGARHLGQVILVQCRLVISKEKLVARN